jgi:DNA-binding transcriptional ArsR family regulator
MSSAGLVICSPLNVLDCISIHDYVNDDMSVSVWQDVNVDERDHEAAPPAARTVATVEMLKAMADPTRIAILTVLMEHPNELPVMSVKEIAARLGEPQTKLYRHIKQLEAAGLIKVAATRMVSGILEQRYQATQHDFVFDHGFMREHADESEAAISAILDGFRLSFMSAFRDRRLAPDAIPEAERYRRPTLFATHSRMSPAVAEELRARLQGVMDWMHETETDEPEGVEIEVLIGFYAEPPAEEP